MSISKDYQTKLFPYAYNILGSIEDAQDVIQDVIVNHIERKDDNIQNESAYLIRSVINKSINLKKRNKKIIGQPTWLPEPVATEYPDKKLNSQQIISYSLLVLLEYLNPKERAVFILKQVFDYSHQEIAELFSISIESSRQLLSRAKNTLKKQGADFNFNHAPTTNLLSDYVDIIRNGEVKMLEQMLSEHITALGDGGGKVKLLTDFVFGIKAVALLAVKGYALYLNNTRIDFMTLNHLPSLLFYKNNHLICCQLFDIDIETCKINHIYAIVDPQKLMKL